MIEIKATLKNEGVEVASKIEGTGEEVIIEASLLAEALLKELWKQSEAIGAEVMYHIIASMKSISGFKQDTSFDYKEKKYGKELS